jgi:putative transposase
MKWLIFLLINIITLLCQIVGKGGLKAVISENLILKQQLLIIHRSRKRAPALKPMERLMLGWLSMLISSKRLMKTAIIVKPSTLLRFHQALVKKKYQRLFGSTHRGKPGPKGPTRELVKLVIDIKQQNPHYGCPKIALLIANRFAIDINKDVVRRVLAKYYTPNPSDYRDPSWLSLIGNTKDSLWSVDLFRCESITLQSYWVLVVMDQWSRKIIGFGVHAGPVNGPTLCRMFNEAALNNPTPSAISTDHDPLFKFHRWKANLRLRDIDEIKTIPFTPISHPFVERLIGTIRREFLDRLFFWNSLDLEKKLTQFQDYYNNHRLHSSLVGLSPTEKYTNSQCKTISVAQYNWLSHCSGLFQTPIAA